MPVPAHHHKLALPQPNTNWQIIYQSYNWRMDSPDSNTHSTCHCCISHNCHIFTEVNRCKQTHSLQYNDHDHPGSTVLVLYSTVLHCTALFPVILAGHAHAPSTIFIVCFLLVSYCSFIVFIGCEYKCEYVLFSQLFSTSQHNKKPKDIQTKKNPKQPFTCFCLFSHKGEYSCPDVEACVSMISVRILLI